MGAEIKKNETYLSDNVVKNLPPCTLIVLDIRVYLFPPRKARMDKDSTKVVLRNWQIRLRHGRSVLWNSHAHFVTLGNRKGRQPRDVVSQGAARSLPFGLLERFSRSRVRIIVPSTVCTMLARILCSFVFVRIIASSRARSPFDCATCS